ncbi:hypothetical protein J132_01563 [Termitomyces sp. J132]|nr:hypothetical protein J132_01563 [Termitomyces sp. J132]
MAPSYEFPAPVLSVDVDVVRKLKGGEALTGLWTLFTKCKASIEDGHRLENISWRLWAATTPRLGRISVSEHDRNGILLVDTKNALRNEPGDNPEMEHIPSTHVPLPPYSIPTSSAYSHPKSPTVVDSISTRCNNSFGQIIIDMLPNPLPPITLQSCKESARNDSSQLTLSYFALNQSTAPALAADTHSLPIHCSLPTPTASERHLMPPSTIPAQNLPGSVPVPHVQVQVDPAPPSTPLLTLPQLVIVHPTPGPTPHPTPPASPILGLGTTSDHSQPIEVASVVAAAAFPSPKFTLHADGSTTSSSSDSSSTSGLTNTFSLSATTTSTNSRVTVAAVAQQTKPATDAAISLASGSDLSPANIAAPPPPSASPTPYQPPTPAPAVRKVRSSPTARPSPAQALDPEPSRARPRAPGSLRQTSSTSSTGGSSKGKDERSKSKSRSRSRGRGADGAARAGLTMTLAGGKRGLSTTGGAQRGRAVGLRKSASGKGAAARAIAREREKEKRPTFNIGSHSDDVGSKSAGSGSSVSNAVNGTQKVEEAKKEKQSTLVPPQRQQSSSRMPPPLRHPLPDPATVLPSKRQQSKIVLATSDSDDYETETDITESDSEHGGDEAQRVVEEEGDTADWSSEDMSTDNVEFVRTQPALNQGKKGHIQPQHRSNSTAHITTPHHNNATHNRQRSAYLSRAQQSRRNHAANAQYVVEQAALEAERLRDMFAKKPVPSSEDLAKQRTQSVGLLTQLMHPNPEIFPPTHPYRRGHSSGDVKGTRGLGGLAMTSTSKNVNGNETRERAVMGQGQASTRKQNVQPPQRRASAGPAPGIKLSKSVVANPVASQVQVGSVSNVSCEPSQEKTVVEGSGKSRSVSKSRGGANGVYRPKGRPVDQEMEDSESEGESGDATNGILVSKSVAQEKLKALAARKGIVANDRKEQEEDAVPSWAKGRRTTSLGEHDTSSDASISRPQQSPAPTPTPIPLGHPYNLPLAAPPSTPRTTRRLMLQTEMSESLRRNLLWERQVSKVNRIRRSSSGGGSGKTVLGGGHLRPLTALPSSGGAMEEAQERDERKERALARNRSWANEFHYTGW